MYAEENNRKAVVILLIHILVHTVHSNCRSTEILNVVICASAPQTPVLLAWSCPTYSRIILNCRSDKTRKIKFGVFVRATALLLPEVEDYEEYTLFGHASVQ